MGSGQTWLGRYGGKMRVAGVPNKLIKQAQLGLFMLSRALGSVFAPPRIG